MSTDEYLVDIIGKISTMMDENEDKALNSDELADLTLNQIYYLDFIYKLSEPTFSELAEALKVTKPTVTVAVNKLIKQGYVVKVQSNEDRRVFYLLLTEKGEKVVRLHERAHKDFAKQMITCLDQKELEQLVKIFEKVIRNY